MRNNDLIVNSYSSIPNCSFRPFLTRFLVYNLDVGAPCVKFVWYIGDLRYHKNLQEISIQRLQVQWSLLTVAASQISRVKLRPENRHVYLIKKLPVVATEKPRVVILVWRKHSLDPSFLGVNLPAAHTAEFCISALVLVPYKRTTTGCICILDSSYLKLWRHLVVHLYTRLEPAHSIVLKIHNLLCRTKGALFCS